MCVVCVPAYGLKSSFCILFSDSEYEKNFIKDKVKDSNTGAPLRALKLSITSAYQIADVISSSECKSIPNAGLMLGRRRRRRASINPALALNVIVLRK